MGKTTVTAIVISAVFMLSPGSVSGQTAAFDIFAATDLARVFEDGCNLPSPGERVDLFGIRNEVISGQIAIAAYEELSDVTIEVGDLTAEKGGARIGSGAIAWNFVGGVPVTVNTDRARDGSMSRKAPALFPDYLSEERKISVESGRYKAVWLTIAIPADAAPGKYSGEIRVTTGRGARSLPVDLTVYPLDLPERSSLLTTIWYSTEYFPKFHGIEGEYSEPFFSMLRVYAANMAAHRQNVFRVPLESIMTTEKGGRYEYDFRNFDRWADIFWGTGRMELLETGFVADFGPGRWYSTKIVPRDFPVTEAASGKAKEVPGSEFLPKFLPAFEKHLKEKGWLGKTVFHIADEPSDWNVESWREMSDYVHKLAPGLRRIDAIEATWFDDRLEVWVPKINQLDAWFDTFKKAQAAGNELWYYQAMSTNGYPNRFVDSPLIETRIMRWLNYRFSATGYLDYGFNHWTDDPYSIMWPAYYGIAAHYIVYPKRDGLVSSLRWEQSRNGAADYEYLRMLEGKLEKIKSARPQALGWLDPKRRGIEIASRVIKTMTDFSRNPAVLYAARRAVIDEIMELDTTPSLIVRTEPMEGSRLVFGPAIVEVTGWTEPGCEVTVNGEKSALSKAGVFRHGAFLSPEGSGEIIITTRSAKGSRTVTRRFEVVYP